MNTITKRLPSTLLVEVTARDINEGLLGECRFCPVARAMNRSLRKAGLVNNRVSVGVNYASVHTRRADTRMGSYTLPVRVGEFIRAFDNGVPELQPFGFTATAEFTW
jgi:hypothetical protein